VRCRSHRGITLGTQRGYAAEQQVVAELSRQVGLPVSTAMSATVEAMKHLEIRSTVIATAYKETINQAVKNITKTADSRCWLLRVKGFQTRGRSSCRIMPPIKLRASFIGSIQRLTVC